MSDKKKGDNNTAAMGHDPLAWLTGDDSTIVKAKESLEDSATDHGLQVSGDIILEGSLCIAEAEATHKMLQDILDVKAEILIESAALSRVDTAGVQLLYAFVQEAKKQGIQLQWKSVSDELRNTASTLALDSGMGFKE